MEIHDNRWSNRLVGGTVSMVLLIFILLLLFHPRTPPLAPPVHLVGLPHYPQRTIIRQTTFQTSEVTQFTTPDPPTTIMAWYATELTKLDWSINVEARGRSKLVEQYRQVIACHRFELTILIVPERHEVTQNLTNTGQLHGIRDCP